MSNVRQLLIHFVRINRVHSDVLFWFGVFFPVVIYFSFPCSLKEFIFLLRTCDRRS